MFQVVERPKLYEQVVEQIKGLIIQGVYKKGELLPSEKELIEMTGVSRITIREALRILNEAGVIETHKGKGSFVIVDADEFLSETEGRNYRDDFLNSTRARIILEPAVAKEVAAIATDQELEEIKACLERDSQKNVRFHRMIIETAHNPVLLQWFDQLRDLEHGPEFQRLIRPSGQKSVQNKIQEQHRGIYEALESRNGEFAYFYMKEHLMYMYRMYEEYFNLFG